MNMKWRQLAKNHKTFLMEFDKNDGNKKKEKTGEPMKVRISMRPTNYKDVAPTEEEIEEQTKKELRQRLELANLAENFEQIKDAILETGANLSDTSVEDIKTAKEELANLRRS